jgi:transposase-like protein
MPRTHLPYAPELRPRTVELARAGRKIDEFAREFEPLANAIRRWVKQAARDEGLAATAWGLTLPSSKAWTGTSMASLRPAAQMTTVRCSKWARRFRCRR